MAVVLRLARRVLTALPMLLVAALVVLLPAPAPADEPPLGEPPPPLFFPDACLESQTAVTWSLASPPVSNHDLVDRLGGGDNGKGLPFTASGMEVNVAAPGVLANDTMNGGAVPLWNETRGPTAQVHAELVRGPDHASSFQLKTDGSFTWVPRDNYRGVDSFEYIAEINGMCRIQATVTIGATDLMYPQDDSFVHFGDGEMVQDIVGVLGNDLGWKLGAKVTQVGKGPGTGDGWYANLSNPVVLANGSLFMQTDGRFRFVPNPGFRGIQHFYYRASGIRITEKLGGGVIVEETPGGPVRPAGDDGLTRVSLIFADALSAAKPRGVDDALATEEDEPLSISPTELMANDNQASYMTWVGSAQIGSPTTFRTWHGTLAITYGYYASFYPYVTSIVYTPDADFNGIDYFPYWVASQMPPNTDTAYPGGVWITVGAVPDKPVANNDEVTTDEGVPIVVDVRANDYDDEGLLNTDIWLERTSPRATYVVDNQAGTVTVTPIDGYYGDLLFFNYALFDREGLLSDLASAHVVVKRNDAVDDAFTTPEDTPLVVEAASGLRVNDESDPSFADVLELVTPPKWGTLDLEPDGSFEYVPDPDREGDDKFTYAYRSPTGVLGDLGTVELEVTPVDDAPRVAVAPRCEADEICLNGEVREIDEGGSVTLSGYLTDPELSAGELRIAWGDGDTTTASYPCEGPDCQFGLTPTYSPVPTCVNAPTGPATCPLRMFFRFSHKYADDRPDADDRYFIDVTADDGQESTAGTSALVRNVAPDLSLLSDAEVTVEAGKPVTVSARVVDPGNDPRVVGIDWGDGSEPATADIVCDAGLTDCTNTATHTFATPSATPYTITLFTDDGDGGNDAETVTVNVTGDLPPTAGDDEAEVDEDGVLEVPAPGLLGLASDPNGDEVTLVSTTQPGQGTLETAPDGSWKYTPPADFHGQTSFEYTVEADAVQDTGEVTITVNPVNDAPTAGDLAATTPEDQAVTITPDLADVDGDALVPQVVAGPDHGSATVVAGKLVYTPAADFYGSDSFTYRASDGTAVSPAATVRVTVDAVGDAPQVGTLGDVSAVYSDAIAPVAVTATDADSASLTYSATGLPAGLSIAPTAAGATISGEVTADPGRYTVTVRVCDPDDQCGTEPFDVVVAAEQVTVLWSAANPVSVAVGRSGAPATTLTARITDSADGAFGDVARIVAQSVRASATPVGGGSTTGCPVTIVGRTPATATAPGFVDVSCTLPAGLKADVYELDVSVDGSFTGSDSELLGVFDAKARGASGAGSVLLGNGNTLSFGLLASGEGKKLKGQVELIERTPAGAIVNRVKGVTLTSLSVSAGSPKTAVLNGKAVVNGVGNYAYVVTVTDAATDTFALKVTPHAEAPAVPSLTFAARQVRTGSITVA
ncbi:Ig-like domain-containing protein [Nocardioides bigeumensis]|uniref:RapA2 cadherin-like domain-containing protein n=1 Tax=Nocardioides bigeumensis TaxID=433657 RepID=A0ABP5KKZ1_9ACTN